MPGIPGAIREGLLGVRRRKGLEPRYFVLFDDRLDYFGKEEEAADGAEPRGRLALSDIRRFEASEGELSFHLGTQTLALSALEGVDLQPWIQDIRATLEAEPAPGDEEIPWEEVAGRFPISQDPEARAARSALFEGLDRTRSGGVPVAESERFLLERLVVRRLDSGGKARRVSLVSGLPPLAPVVHRAVDIASDVAAHHAPRECDGLDRGGFHAALVYLHDYLELCALYKQVDISAEVEVKLAAALASQWGISDRVSQHYMGCKMAKFEDFADWLLWCKLMHSETLVLDDPDDFPLHEAPHWSRIEETAARRIQKAQRARQARGAGARAEAPPAAEALGGGEARAAEADAAEAREAEAREAAAAAAAAEAREAEARAAEAREAEARAAELRAAEAREAEARAAEARAAEARAAELRAAEAREEEARAAEAREAEARAAEARAAEAREAEARAAEDRAVQALQASEEADEDVTETEEADHDAGVLCQGPLTVEKGGKSSRRHHVLFCDRLCSYEDEQDFFQGKDPRGSIALADVECVEEMGKSFQLLLKNSKSVTEFQAESKEDAERWLHAWALVLQGNLGVSFARSKHKSIYPPPQPVVDDASQDDQPTIICEGSVDMMKRSKAEPRYFVLFERHFEYFNSQEEFGSGAPPRCRVALEDVQDVEVSSSGHLVIQLAQGKTFEMRAGGREDARRWGGAWDKALSEGIFLAGAGTVSWGEGWEEEQQQQQEPRAAVETSLGEGRLGGGFLDVGPASDARAEVAEAAEAASDSCWEPERGKREVSKQSSVTWDLKVEEERVLHEGVLVMGRGEDNLQPRFAVVLSDRLEYSSDWNTETKASGPPRTRILRSQIRDAEVVDEGFNLELDDGILLMRTSCEADQQAWLEALEAMLNDQEPSGPPINGHAPEPEPAMTRPHVLLQETLGMEFGGQVEQKHCVLYPDCLEYFSSLAEAESGARPHGVLWKKDFSALEGLDLDLVLHAGDRTVVLCAKDRASFLAWQKALLPLFGNGGDGPGWSRHAPAAEPPRPPLCQGPFLVSWGVGGPEAEEVVALHPDRLECASGHVPTHEIEDVEVCDEGFVVHGRGGCRLSLRSADSAMDMEAWLAALGRVLDGGEAAAADTPPPPPPPPSVPTPLSETGSGSRSGHRGAGSGACRKLCRTSSDLAAGPTRCVHEGPLELEPWRGPRRPRHAVLYGNKLDLFGAAEEADGGHPPCLSVPVVNIQELRVLDLAFELRTFAASAPRQLRVPARRDFEEWLRAWGLVLGGSGGMERRADGRGWVRRAGLGASRESLPARMHRGVSFGGADQPRSSSVGRGADQPGSNSSGRGRWAFGRSATSSNLLSRGRILHQGPLALVRLGRTEAYHFVAYADRLEYFLDAAHASAGASRRGVLRPGDIREVRVLEHGFVLGMNREIIELHVASTRDMDAWVKVLRTVLDPATAADEEQEPPRAPAAEDQEEELEGMSSYFSQAPVDASCLGGSTESSGSALLADWLDSLPEPPLHRGELGFQDRGRLTRRYCVLFRDRLDCWEAMSQVGSKPLVQIQLSDIRGLEIISSGFVLNSRGRRTGVHVSNNEELQVWTHALLSVLAPSESSEATTPATPQTSVPSTPSAAGPAQRPSRPRSANQSSGGATQRASSARPSGMRSKSPSSPRLAPFVPRVANLTPSAASRGQSPQRQNSFQSSSRSLQHDSTASSREHGPLVKLGRPQGRETGGEWACREVAAKIVEPAPGRSPLLQRKEERGSLAEKVTGRPAAATTRARVEISGKITDTVESARGQGAAASARGRGAAIGEAVAPKVNESGRVPLIAGKTMPAHGMAEKITQARGSRRPAAAPPGRHAGQPLGLPGHAPGFLA